MRNGNFWPRVSWLLVILGLGLVGPSLERLDRAGRPGQTDVRPAMIITSQLQGREQP